MRVVLATGHSNVQMGQQHYERWLTNALLDTKSDVATYQPVSLRSWRAAPTGGDRARQVRYPHRAWHAVPHAITRPYSRFLYGKADVYHRFDLRLPGTPGPEVLTIHDLPGLRFADEGALSNATLHSAAAALAVICPSEFAAREVHDLLRTRRTVVIPNGVSPHIATAEPVTPEQLLRLGIDRPFVLHAGGSSERKNLPGLAQAWRLTAARFRDHVLVTCGPDTPSRQQAFQDVPSVVHLGYLPPAIIAQLMLCASAVVVPSLYEGFGLPALEAMASGAPVVASARGALPEVCGDAAILVEPTAEGLADGLSSVLADLEGARLLGDLGRARAGAYTWARAARAHAEVYEEVAGA